MTKLTTLLEELSDDDIQWLLATGVEERVESGTVVISEGEYIGSIYMVLEGTLGVYISVTAPRLLNTVGAGEILGEMSYLEDKPTAATVIALENVVLLNISRESLDNKMYDEPDFGRRFYKGIGIFMSRRLRQVNTRMDYILEALEHAKKWPLEDAP
ncbi:cyclic nucleotide-binding protein [Candidatus Magnetobacterium bavaricum]|uniref:Cyclic nucleotide-binding protein n=1 Tax=Candidatus Magnetobacterium bavaricum TaxID=29290 RepID=A0A0F3GKZ1_9BACT|nr:cyclic nucleotide-binding protein [Candidatus Magnetobacterium bavaricum]